MAGDLTLTDAHALHAWCRTRLAEYNAAALRDPLATGVRRLTIDLLEQLQSGIIDAEKLRLLSKLISDRALYERALRLSAKASVKSWGACAAGALRAIEAMPPDEAKKAVSLACAGVVFTAHPTFAMSRRLRAAVGRMASTSASPEEALAGLAHAPDPTITLDDEHEDALAAILRAQDALRDLCRAVVDRLAEKFPDEWADMTPTPISLATWVGYDLDGRTDIHWGQTFRIRLQEKAAQLGRYAQTLADIDAPGASALAARLSAAAEEAASQAALFAADLDEPNAVVAAANRLTAEGPRRLVSLEPIILEISGLIAAALSLEAKKSLCVLRAEMKNYGLGVARVHLRVNAAQVRSAVRADLGFDMGRGFLDRTALDAVAERSAHVAEQSLNFGSVFLEKMTARRQLMLSAQLLKHVDADAPIRFLIAEAEAPATIMAAVYLARLYGVDHRLDISPLFETPDALERAGRFMERLLNEDEYVAYIKARGRVSIQLGFSDSGRFMGQIAAAMAIERAQILLSRALTARKICDVEVVIFNTHGESMGRGGHPGSFKERLNHLMTPWARARFAHDGFKASA
ncbi:MAG: phosphoenolpyruvate carboxylase, partial [Parvularculaceae bacterium]